MDFLASVCSPSPFAAALLRKGCANDERLDKAFEKNELRRRQQLIRTHQPKQQRVWRPQRKAVHQRRPIRGRGGRGGGAARGRGAGAGEVRLIEDPVKVAEWEQCLAEARRDDAEDTGKRKMLPGQWRSVRVFISSTFIDTHGERDELIQYVFPELNRRLAERFVRIIPVDLRWGITDEQSDSLQTLCLDEIDRCSADGALPWFVALRTRRMGWVPPKFSRPSQFMNPSNLEWLRPFDVKGSKMSITNMEVYHAFLGRDLAKQTATISEIDSDDGSDESSVGSSIGDIFGSGSDDDDDDDDDNSDETINGNGNANQEIRYPRSFFMFRKDNFLKDVPTDMKWIFDFEYRESAQGLPYSTKQQYTITPDVHTYQQTMMSVNQAIRESLHPKAVCEYDCTYASAEITATYASSGKKSAIGRVGGLDTFNTFLLEQMTTSLEAEYKVHGTVSPRDLESAVHEAYIQEKTASFVGREDELHNLMESATSKSGQKQACVVVGGPGVGKSALLSRFIQSFRDLEKADTITVVHMVGATGSSTDIQRMLIRICYELKDKCPALQKTDVPENDFTRLSKEWVSVFLARAARKKRVVLVIDALNQLSPGNAAHAMGWLPDVFPSNVTCIASCLDHDNSPHATLKNLLEAQPGAAEVELPHLSKEEQVELVTKYLSVYHKVLTSKEDGETKEDNQLGLLLCKRGASLPLYLVVAADLMRRYGVYEKLTDFIEDLPATIESLFKKIIRDLEEQYGANVKAALSLLGASRQGMLESDLVQLIPTVTKSSDQGFSWSQLYISIKQLLVGGDSGFFTFFHGKLQQIVQEHYQVGAHFQGQEYHVKLNTILAEYYWNCCQAEVQGGDFQANSQQAFSDLVFHMMQAGQVKKIRLLFLSMDWLTLKVYHSSLYGLIQDIDLYLTKFPRDGAIRTLRTVLVLCSRAVEIDSRQLGLQLLCRLKHVLSRNPDLGELFHKEKWRVATNSFTPRFMAITQPGGAEHARITNAGLPVSADGLLKPIINQTADLCYSFYRDGKIVLNSLAGGFQLGEMRGHKKEVYRVVQFGEPKEGPNAGYDADADTPHAISCAKDLTIIAWDLNNVTKGNKHGSIVHKIEDLDSNVSQCVVVKGEKVAVFTTRTKLYVWDFKSSEPAYAKFDASEEKILGLAMCDGAERRNCQSCFVASYGKDCKITVWDINKILEGDNQEGSAFYVLSAHKSPVIGVKFSAANSMCSFDEGGNVLIWNFGRVLKAIKEGKKSKFQSVGLSPNHETAVKDVVFLKGGVRLVTFDQSGELLLWTFPANKRKSDKKFRCIPLVAHVDAVLGVVPLSEDSEMISYGKDRTINLWNLDEAAAVSSLSESNRYIMNQKWRHPMKGHSKGVEGVVLMNQNTMALSYSRDHTVIVWDLASIRKQSTCQLMKKPEPAKSSHKESRLFKSRMLRKAIQEGKAEAPKKGDKKKKQEQAPPKVNAKPMPLSYCPFVKLKGHNDWVKGVRLFREENVALTFGGQELFLWDLQPVKQALQDQIKGRRPGKKRHIPAILRGHPTRVQDATVFIGQKGAERDTSYCAMSISKDDTVIEWNLDVAQEEARGKRQMMIALVEQQEVEQAKHLRKRIRTKVKKAKPKEAEEKEGEEDDPAAAAAPERPSMFPSTSGHTKWVTGIRLYGNDNKSAVSWGKDGKIVLWNLSTSRETAQDFDDEVAFVKRLSEHTDFVRGVLVKDDGKSLVSWSNDSSIILWDMQGEQPRPLKLTEHSELVLGVRWVDDMTKMLSYARDQTIILWDIKGTNTKSLCKLTGHEAWIRGCQVVRVATVNKEYIISHSDDGTLKVWDLDKARKGSSSDVLVMTLEGHTAKIFGAIAISQQQSQRDSKDSKLTTHLLSYSADSSMILWDLEESVKLGTPCFEKLEGHRDWVTGASLTAIPLENGKRCHRLLSWSRDGSARLWNIGPLLQGNQDKSVPSRVMQCGLGVLSCVLSRNGRTLTAYGVDSSDILVWDLASIVTGEGERYQYNGEGYDGGALPVGVSHVLRSPAMTGPLAKVMGVSNDKVIASQGTTLTLWDITKGISSWRMTFDTQISTFSVAKDFQKGQLIPTHLFVGHTDGQVSFFEL